MRWSISISTAPARERKRPSAHWSPATRGGHCTASRRRSRICSTSSRGGIRALKHHVVNGYCVFCERMEKRGGAVFLGKTNSPLMGFRGTCDNYLFGPTRNPFNLAKNSGGSSGGSAAAVADGLLPIAEGTDAGGSIRIPSAWCGVYGYKASFGRVPFLVRPNAFGVADSPFLFEGPITRTVEDAAIALNVLAG